MSNENEKSSFKIVRISEYDPFKTEQKYAQNPFELVLKRKKTRINGHLKDLEVVMKNNDLKLASNLDLSAVKEVDSSGFVKIHFDFIRAWNSLLNTKRPIACMRFLNVLTFKILDKSSKKIDRIVLNGKDRDEFNATMAVAYANIEGKALLPSPTVKDDFKFALKECIKCGLIARTERRGEFWINPNMVFNGEKINRDGLTYREELQESIEKQKQERENAQKTIKKAKRNQEFEDMMKEKTIISSEVSGATDTSSILFTDDELFALKD